MSFSIFKGKNRNLFLIFFVLGFWMIQPVQKVEACNWDSDCAICEKCTGFGGTCYNMPSFYGGVTCAAAGGNLGVWYDYCNGNNKETYAEICETFLGIHSCNHKWGSTTACSGATSFCCQTGAVPFSGADCKASCVVCTRTNPTVNRNPPSQTVSAGDTATYSISIANNDSAFSCGDNSTFNLTLSGCPGGWTCSIAGSVSVQAGSSQSSNLTITSPIGTSAGTTTVAITATHGADNTKTGSNSVDYVIAPAGGLTVNPNPSSIPASTNTNVTFFVRHPDGTNGTNAVVNLSSGQNCNTGATGFCSITVNSAIAITVIASKATYIDGTATITIIVAGCGAPASCAGCVNGTPCTGGTCSGEICVPAGPGPCNQLACGGAVSNQPCMCGAQLISTNGNYCCAASNYYGNETTCKNPSNCSIATSCNNNGTIDAGEQCDGAALGGETCVSRGFTGGSLSCSSCVFNMSACTGGGGGGGSGCDNKVWFFCNPLRGTIEDIFQAGETLIGYVLGLIGSIALLLIIIAGVMYMTSMGNEEKITTSKKIVTGAVIGLAIALLSYSLLQLVLSTLS
jgi:hypothetical protein